MVGVSVFKRGDWVATADFVESVVTLVLTVVLTVVLVLTVDDTDGDADNDAAADNVAIVTDAEDDCERVK